MGRYTAPSDLDFRAEQDWDPRMVEETCEDCGEVYEIPYSDGPPVGRAICEVCKAELREQQRRETLRQWVEQDLKRA